MTMLGWLFGGRSAHRLDSRQLGVSDTPPRSLQFISDDMARVLPEGRLGRYARSANMRYTLVWCDNDPGGRRSGARQEGHGHYFLFHKDGLVAEGATERPNDGKVADNGTFILNDWHFGSGLKGTFRAFAASAQCLLERKFDANLLNNGISDDGQLAVCQTCNAPGSPDSSKLTLFSLQNRQELISWAPESGWARSYTFDVGRKRIALSYGDGGTFEHTFDGAFPDRSLWIEHRLRAGDVYMALRLIDENAGLVPKTHSALIQVAAERALAGSEDRWTMVQAHKVQARLHEAAGRIDRAIDSYNQALLLDPKAGVRRRIKELASQISNGA